MQVRSRDSRTRLEQFIEADREVMLKTLRYYVLRAGLANSSAAWSVAEELFHEIIVEGFRSADRLKPDLEPKPWLLGIAANLIKRKQVETVKRHRREPLLRDLYPQSQAALSDEELFDQLPIVSDTSFDDLEVNEQINRILSGVPKSDADLLRLAILHDLNGAALAQELGISPGAVRVRLHRALNRLRAVQEERDAHE